MEELLPALILARLEVPTTLKYILDPSSTVVVPFLLWSHFKTHCLGLFFPYSVFETSHCDLNISSQHIILPDLVCLALEEYATLMRCLPLFFMVFSNFSIEFLSISFFLGPNFWEKILVILLPKSFYTALADN